MEPVKTSSVSPAVQRQVAVASSLPIVTKASRNSVQPSLKVSSPTDSAEVEAVHVAKKIMRTQISSHEVPNTQPATAGKVFRLKTNGKEGKIQRQGEGTPQVSAGLSSQIQNSSSEGSPLPVPVRSFMEPRFQADFSNVKIHTSESSASMNTQLSAKAFTVGNQVFFGKDQFRPDHDDGKELIAHELTHTIQQGAAIQRSEDTAVTQTSGVKVQRLGLSDALDYFADKANLIPGFRMFTIILGVNPINMSAVSRNAANILRAIIELLPGGALITQALDNHGIIDKVAGWIEQQINTLGMTGSIIKAAISKFLDSLSWRDIFDLGGVWNRAKKIFTEPIDRIISFGKGLITGIIKFIKEAILRPLAKLAEGTAGYDLLKAVLGEDPVTGDPVPRNADTLIGGFMKLIGQQEVWENIKKGNAIAKAWAWFQNALKDLMGFVKQIPSLFVKAFTSLELMDIILVPRAFAKIISVFGSFMGQFLSWAGNTVISLLQIIFEVVAPKAVPYLNKAVSTFKIIIKEPIKFVGNLVKAGKQGFQMFADNILEHLKTALINWIVGPLGEAGVYIPKSFTLIEVVKLVLSILGLTWQNIRSKLVKIIPEPVMVVLEKSAGILVTLITQGPAAAWEQIKAELTELKDQLISQVTQMITTEVVKAATIKLVSMLNPAGAVIQAIIAIYDTVTFFIDKAKQIAAVVASFIDSVSEIASGQVATAAKAVEKTMANTLTVVLAFLAKFVGLGKVPDKLVGIIKKIRQPIDKGLDKIVAWLGNMLKKLVDNAKKLVEWWRIRKKFSADGEAHTLSFSGEKKAAKLMIASAPIPLSEFLAAKRKDPVLTKQQSDKIPQIETLLKAIAAAEQYPEDKYEQAQKEIDSALNNIMPLLIFLLSGTEFGSDLNPLPIEYTKRRAGLYPVIYIGPKSAARVEQSWLQSGDLPKIKSVLSKPELDEWGTRGFKIQACYPTKKTPLPGGPEIGIKEAFQVSVGTRIEYGAGKTQGGGLINNILKPYGFFAGAEKYDGDHIVEMQIGGPNHPDNLWPLERGENRSSGSLLKNLIKAAKEKVKTSAHAPANTDKFFIVITKTRTD